MFTVKFMNHRLEEVNGAEEPCTEFETVISCVHYEACKKSYGWDIITYGDMTDCDGVERQVMKQPTHRNHKIYDVCYIENVKGQTINSYHRS